MAVLNVARLRVLLPGAALSVGCFAQPSTLGDPCVQSIDCDDGLICTAGKCQPSGASADVGDATQTTADSADPTTAGTSGTSGGGTSSGGSATASSSSSAGSSASSGSSSSTSSSTGDSGDLMCDEGHEPNDSEAGAARLSALDDCDSGGSVGMVQADLGGVGDVDWYVFEGYEGGGFCIVDPLATLQVDAAVRFCMFAECLSGTTSVGACPAGSTRTTSDQGRPGCCVTDTTGVTVPLSLSCTGVSEYNADIYLRVDDAFGDVCIPYTIDYHY